MELTWTVHILFLSALIGHVHVRADNGTCDYQSVVNSYRDMLRIISPVVPEEQCCPDIVPQQAPGIVGGSVVTADTGHRANVAGIVYFRKRTCAGQWRPPGGFQWTVFWGDGSYSSKQTDTLGPFQATHQYDRVDRSYMVIAYYCATPPLPTPGCCDSLIDTIDVRAK